MTEDVRRYREHVERLVQAVLGTHGDTEPSLRHAIEARVANLGSRIAQPPAGTLPVSVGRYIDNVGLHAYRVTDADVEALRDAGYSEDAIFEITLTAAVGAAMGRLDRGLRALQGHKP
jgi:alkylhydroperoxidase family enzyme